MQLTTGAVHRLYIALVRLEREEDFKFAGDTRLSIAININKLRPLAEAFDRTQARVLADLNKDNRLLAENKRRSDAEIQSDLLQQLESLRDKEEDVGELRTLLKPDLRLEDNPKLGGRTLADLAPILPWLDETPKAAA